MFAPFQKQQEFLDAVLSGQYSFVLYGGAIRGGKTYALLALFIILSKIFPKSRWAIVRADLPTIKRNTYPSWEKIKPSRFIKHHDKELHTVTFNNGSQIIFFPESYDTDKELNRWRGLEANGFGFEEINECQEITLGKAFERAGSYIIKDAKNQPPPIVVGTCNPSFGWVKEKIYNPWKNSTLNPRWHYIQSRIYDNTPLMEAQPLYLQNLKDNLSRYEYEVFVEGNWDIQLKTGGEFLKNFELDKHLTTQKVDIEKVIHISIDSNVYPYFTVTFWQLIKDNNQWVIRQVHEICAKDPDNTPHRAGILTANYLKSIGYNQRIYQYGDRSTKNRNNIDDQKRSVAEIFMQAVNRSGFEITDKFLTHAPSVSNIADFVNNIFDGTLNFARIEINENCKNSISDYIETKQDRDGSILKKRITDPRTNVSYEPNGHITDTFKDFVVSAFYQEFLRFQDRFKNFDKMQTATISRKDEYTL